MWLNTDEVAEMPNMQSLASILSLLKLYNCAEKRLKSVRSHTIRLPHLGKFTLLDPSSPLPAALRPQGLE